MNSLVESTARGVRLWLADARGPRLMRSWLATEWRLLTTAAVVGYALTCLAYISANSLFDRQLKVMAKRDVARDAAAALDSDPATLCRLIRYGQDVSSWRQVANKPVTPWLTLPWYLAPYLNDAVMTKTRWQKVLADRATEVEGTTLSSADSDQGSAESNALLEEFRQDGWYRLRRYLNGGIQLVTMWLACTGLLLIAQRARVARWHHELRTDGSVQLPVGGHSLAEASETTLFATREGILSKDSDFAHYVRFLESVAERLSRRHLPTDLIATLLASARAYQTTETVEEARERLDSGIEHVRTEAESQGSMIRYIVWAVPSVGFIGTVLGIGNALGEAHQVLKGGSQKEGAIQEITGQLGTAFDTTLIALLCSLVLMFFWHWVTRSEEKAIHAFHNAAKTRVVNRLSGLELGAQFQQILEGQTEEMVRLFKRHWRQWEQQSLERRLKLVREDQAAERELETPIPGDRNASEA